MSDRTGHAPELLAQLRGVSLGVHALTLPGNNQIRNAGTLLFVEHDEALRLPSGKGRDGAYKAWHGLKKQFSMGNTPYPAIRPAMTGKNNPPWLRAPEPAGRHRCP